MRLDFGLSDVGECNPDSAMAWWEWQDGSTPYFWHWPEDYQSDVRDGQPHYLTGDFGIFVKPQARANNPGHHEKMREKVVGLRKRDYIEPYVKSLLHFFCVPKGLADIRHCLLRNGVWTE